MKMGAQEEVGVASRHSTVQRREEVQRTWVMAQKVGETPQGTVPGTVNEGAVTVPGAEEEGGVAVQR